MPKFHTEIIELKIVQTSSKYLVNPFLANRCVEKCSKRVFSGPYFPVFELNTEIYSVNLRISVFSPNTGKYGPKKIPYLDTFHTVNVSILYSLQTLNNKGLPLVFWCAFYGV